jgi:hypothetical protein
LGSCNEADDTKKKEKKDLEQLLKMQIAETQQQNDKELELLQQQ